MSPKIRVVALAIALALTATGATAVTSSGTAFAAQAWSTAHELDPGHAILDFSCVSASFCVGGDTAGNIVEFTGITHLSLAPIVASSCTTTGFCMVFDSDNHAYLSTNDFAQQTVDAGGVQAVSCSSSSFCMATDAGGGYVTYDGSTWAGDQSMGEPSGDSATQVSCVSQSFCAAVDDSGNAFTYDGTSWTSDGQIDAGGGPFAGVSCTSPSFCAAVNGAAVYTFNGSTWSSPDFIDPGGTLDAVSCTSSTFCMTTDSLGVDGGNVVDSRSFTFNGSSWSAPQLIEALTSTFDEFWVTAVQCVSPTLCAAVDSLGNGLLWNSVAGFGVSTTSVPAASRGVPYGPVTLTASIDPSASPYVTKVKWHKVSLPKGLKLSKTGVLSGTPGNKVTTGTSSVKVSVSETVTTLNGKKKVKTKKTVQATIPLTIT